MSKTILQKILFKKATPHALFDLYMNSKKHSAVTGGPAVISSKPGADFSAHGGYITGRNIQIVKDELIVQLWRGSDWKRSDPDSFFMLYFQKKGKDTVLHMVHANVPDDQAKGIDSGWHEFYWAPWKKMLKRT